MKRWMHGAAAEEPQTVVCAPRAALGLGCAGQGGPGADPACLPASAAHSPPAHLHGAAAASGDC